MNNQNKPEEMAADLRKRGLRLTPQRLSIIKSLAAKGYHPTAAEVYAAVRRELPMTSLATVYKTLAVLKEAGAVVELRGRERAPRFDGSGKPPHPHLICGNCSRIFDFEFPALDELPEVIENQSGFKVHHYRLDLFGICKDCQNL